MGRLSTHVLDTSRGRPADGVAIRVFLLDGETPRLLKTAITNREGRTDEPLLSADRLATGRYDLVFSAGAYFLRLGSQLTNPPFLDEVVIRFGLADPEANYHVPLLISPYGYSTYRGS